METYRVRRTFGGNSRESLVALDPDGAGTQALLRDGYIESPATDDDEHDENPDEQ